MLLMLLFWVWLTHFLRFSMQLEVLEFVIKKLEGTIRTPGMHNMYLSA